MSEMETQDVEVKPPVEKRARFSKNKKKNWGKFDQTEIDEALEDKRRNEVLHGTSDMAEVKDDDLFVIDRGNKKKEKKKVMTRTQRLLENKSQVPAPLPIEDQPLPNRAKYLMEKKENRKNRTVDLRKQAALKKKSAKQHESERTSLNNTYDLWGSGPQNIPGHSGSNVDTNKNFRAADHSKEMDGRSRVKRPERMKYKPDRAMKIDSVVPAHGGASYNPDYDAHQHLLRQEDTKEEIRVSHEDKIRRKAKPPPKSEQVTEEEIQIDVQDILPVAIRLISACVDVLASNGWLNPALAAMELSQNLTQAVWNKDSYLRQIPHFTHELITKARGANIDSVFDIIEMENDERDDLLKMDEGQMTDVAKFCNRYPNIEMNHEVVDPEEAQTGSPTIVNVTLEREDELQGNVIAPFYPGKRDEGWWLVIGEHKTNSLLAIKHVSLQQKKKIALELVPQKVGETKFVLYMMCDAYAGCDQEYEVNLNVAEGDDSSDDSSEAESGDEEKMEE